MFKSCWSVLLIGFLSTTALAHAADFAETVVRYNPGTGFATEFGSGLGYTNQVAALGEPSRTTPGPFGGPIDPFSPPFQRDQLLSIGTGGSLTVKFGSPIFNDSRNPFGLDFIVFGNSGFAITNGNFTGGGITDGSLFGANSGVTRVFVSKDGGTYFQLDPSHAPTVDGFFPTEGAGNFHVPMNPSLKGANFAGLDLRGIRSLYAGSGGGTGYDISWARDTNGQLVNLDRISLVRVDVVSGVSEVDALASVAPSGPVVVREDFATNPEGHGWKVFGDVSLFKWNPDRQQLEVTWDSAKTNSYFYHSLETMLDKADDFNLSFDLKLEEVAVGVRPGHPFSFQLAVGFLNSQTATQSSFVRGTGTQSPNLVEFNYFPDSGFGATVSPVIVSTNNQFIPSFSFPLEMTIGDLFAIGMSYSSSNQTLVTQMTRNQRAFGPIKEVKLPSTFTDFRVDAIAINSFSDQGSDGSIRARGMVDNVVATFPGHPITGLTGRRLRGNWQVEFFGRTNWNYTLELSNDLRQWTSVSKIAGANGPLRLTDDSGAKAAAFYRVRAERP